MDEQTVREHAQAQCDALMAGDIGRASQHMSRELRANLGQLVAMLPLPLSEAEVENIEMTRNGYRAVLRLTGASGSLLLETRWREREGQATMAEASHLPEALTEPAAEAEAAESAGE